MGNWFSSVELGDLTSGQVNEADKELERMEEIQKQLSDHKTECDLKFEYIDELKQKLKRKRLIYENTDGN